MSLELELRAALERRDERIQRLERLLDTVIARLAPDAVNRADQPSYVDVRALREQVERDREDD